MGQFSEQGVGQIAWALKHIKLIAADILDVFGDNQSQRFYLLVARKIPEDYIRETLSELKQSTVRSKARVFTRKMLDFTDATLNKKLEQEFCNFKSRRVEIAERFRSHQWVISWYKSCLSG